MKDKMFPCIQRPNTKEYDQGYENTFGKKIMWWDKRDIEDMELLDGGIKIESSKKPRAGRLKI